jgi:hypothetical protein
MKAPDLHGAKRILSEISTLARFFALHSFNARVGQGNIGLCFFNIVTRRFGFNFSAI